MKRRIIEHIPIYKLIEITSPDVSLLKWSKAALPNGHRLYIPGAFTYRLSGEWGVMIFIHVPGLYYDIWISYYDVWTSAAFFTTGTIALTECCFELENDKLHEVLPFYPVYCEAGTYNLYHIPSVKSRVYFNKNKPVTTLDIHLKKPMLEKLQKSFPAQIVPIIHAGVSQTAAYLFGEPQICTSEMNGHLNRLMDILHKEGATADIRDIVYPLLHAALGKPEMQIKPSVSVTVPDITELCKLMQSAFPRRYSLMDLAQKSCMSRSSFIRAFSKQTGTTVEAYYKRLAMNTAFHLIQNTSRSLSQIAEDTGYASKHTLSRAVKGYYNKRPSDIRKNGTSG